MGCRQTRQRFRLNLYATEFSPEIVLTIGSVVSMGWSYKKKFVLSERISGVLLVVAARLFCKRIIKLETRCIMRGFLSEVDVIFIFQIFIFLKFLKLIFTHRHIYS